jgi:hypothetical protein
MSSCPTCRTLRMKSLRGSHPEVRDWEPREALVAANRGLALVLGLVKEAGAVLHPGGLLALEVGSTQTGVVADQIRGAGGFGEPEPQGSLPARADRAGCARWQPGGASRRPTGCADDESAGEPRGGSDGTERGQLMSKIDEMAKDLGQALGRTDEYQALKRAADPRSRRTGISSARTSSRSSKPRSSPSCGAGRNPTEDRVGIVRDLGAGAPGAARSTRSWSRPRPTSTRCYSA